MSDDIVDSFLEPNIDSNDSEDYDDFGEHEIISPLKDSAISISSYQSVVKGVKGQLIKSRQCKNHTKEGENATNMVKFFKIVGERAQFIIDEYNLYNNNKANQPS